MSSFQKGTAGDCGVDLVGDFWLELRRQPYAGKFDTFI